MAQQIITTLTDDISGETADETIRFALDGKPYEIDLTAANADRFRASLAEYIGHARRAGSAPKASGRAPRRQAGDREQMQAIRDWAKSQGMDVKNRGRIPVEIQLRYDQAHAPA